METRHLGAGLMPGQRARMLAASLGATGLIQAGNAFPVHFLVAVVAFVVGVLVVLWSKRLSATIAWLIFILQRRPPDDRLPERPDSRRALENHDNDQQVVAVVRWAAWWRRRRSIDV